MKLFTVIKSLLPHIDKNKVTEDLRLTSAELDNFVIPSYNHAAEFFKSNKINSDANKSLSTTFYRNFDLHGAVKLSTFINEIQKRLIFIKDNTDYISAIAEDLYERDIIAEGLTVKKAIILRAVGNLSFISRYAINLLNLCYVNEAIAKNAELEESMRLAPQAIKNIEDNIIAFTVLLSEYGIPNKKFSLIVLNTPDIILSSKTEQAVSNLYKERDIDPFPSPFKTGFTGSPIFHLGLVVTEWQASRYKSNRDKKKMLELRLLQLKLLNEDKNDARIEREIDYIKDRVDRLDQYLLEVEASVN